MVYADCYVIENDFAGLLSAVYEALWRGRMPEMVFRRSREAENDLFAAHGVRVLSNKEKAQRVWTRLQKRLSKPMLNSILCAYCCNCDYVDGCLLRLMYRAIVSPTPIENDFSDTDLSDMVRYSRISRLGRGAYPTLYKDSTALFTIC